MYDIKGSLKTGITVIVLANRSVAGKVKSIIDDRLSQSANKSLVTVMVPRQDSTPESIWKQASTHDSPQYVWLLGESIQSLETKNVPMNLFVLTDTVKDISIPPELSLAQKVTSKEFAEWIAGALSEISANETYEGQIRYLGGEKASLASKLRDAQLRLSAGEKERETAGAEKAKATAFWKRAFFVSLGLWVFLWSAILAMIGNPVRGHAIVDVVSGFLKGFVK